MPACRQTGIFENNIFHQKHVGIYGYFTKMFFTLIMGVSLPFLQYYTCFFWKKQVKTGVI